MTRSRPSRDVRADAVIDHRIVLVATAAATLAVTIYTSLQSCLLPWTSSAGSHRPCARSSCGRRRRWPSRRPTTLSSRLFRAASRTKPAFWRCGSSRTPSPTRFATARPTTSSSRRARAAASCSSWSATTSPRRRRQRPPSGLARLRRRAQVLGGQLVLETLHGGRSRTGARLKLTLPLSEESAGDAAPSAGATAAPRTPHPAP